MFQVKSLGMIDCWEFAGKHSPVETCRFDTRIDYIFVSPSFFNTWKIEEGTKKIYINIHKLYIVRQIKTSRVVKKFYVR